MNLRIFGRIENEFLHISVKDIPAASRPNATFTLLSIRTSQGDPLFIFRIVYEKQWHHKIHHSTYLSLPFSAVVKFHVRLADKRVTLRTYNVDFVRAVFADAASILCFNVHNTFRLRLTWMRSYLPRQRVFASEDKIRVFFYSLCQQNTIERRKV